MQNREEVLGYVPAYAGMQYLCLVFTTSRLIIARTTGGLGTTLLLGPVLQSYMAIKRSEELGRLTPEGVLSAGKDNYAIPYSEILQVRLKQPGTLRDGSVVILTNQGETKFGMARIGLMKTDRYDFRFLEKLRELLAHRLVTEESRSQPKVEQTAIAAKFCHQCAAKISRESKYCEACGAKVA